MGKQCFGAPVGRREEKGEDVDIPTEKREVGSGPGNRRDGWIWTGSRTGEFA
jgi:hypothetical protein